MTDDRILGMIHPTQLTIHITMFHIRNKCASSAKCNVSCQACHVSDAGILTSDKSKEVNFFQSKVLRIQDYDIPRFYDSENRRILGYHNLGFLEPWNLGTL